jgi:hypothetical protein
MLQRERGSRARPPRADRRRCERKLSAQGDKTIRLGERVIEVYAASIDGMRHCQLGNYSSIRAGM